MLDLSFLQILAFLSLIPNIGVDSSAGEYMRVRLLQSTALGDVGNSTDVMESHMTMFVE